MGVASQSKRGGDGGRDETPPQIETYDDYRFYMRDFYEYKKSQSPGFSYRLFAQRAGVKSPNYLQLVIQGKRNLSEAMGYQVAQAMSLEGAMKEYFVSLVHLANARGPEEEVSAQKRCLRNLRLIISKEVPKSQRQVVSQWQHMAIRELLFLSDFQFSGEWVSKKMRGLISAKQAQESLELLVKSGFIEQQKNEGWKARDPVIDTGPDGFSEVSVLGNHAGALKIWAKGLEKFPKEQRELGLLNIPINTSKVPELKNRLREFQDEIIGWLQDEEDPNQIVQVGTYMIPLTE